MRKKKAWNEKGFVTRTRVSPSLLKPVHDTHADVHYRIPPCFYLCNNWCELREHSLCDYKDLEEEPAKHVREHKNRINPKTQEHHASMRQSISDDGQGCTKMTRKMRFV